MKPIYLALIVALTLFSCRKITKETVVEGYIRDNNTKKPIANVRVGVFKMSNNFTFNSYQLVTETFTDNDGYYKIVTSEPIEIVHAAIKGYFDEENFEKRTLKENSKNKVDIYLMPACKANFTLVNKGQWQKICLSTLNAKARDCEFDYSSECYYNVKEDTTTSCYIWGGDSAKIEYLYYPPNSVNSIRFDTTIFFPAGKEINVILNY